MKKIVAKNAIKNRHVLLDKSAGIWEDKNKDSTKEELVKEVKKVIEKL